MAKLAFATVLLLAAIPIVRADEGKSRSATVEEDAQIVERIRQADYRADRSRLKILREELAPIAGSHELNSRIAYWRGFAMWRKAINGFNDSAPREEGKEDLQAAVADFEEAIRLDSTFSDAKSALAGCWMSLLFLNQNDPEYLQAHIGKIRLLLDEAQASEPDNPRVLWVVGGSLWYRPVDKGGGQEKAIATYERGLQKVAHPQPSKSALDPNWGEPELLMNLAWSNLNRSRPDLATAERYARSALALVPDWHYVKDILLPQIAAAKNARNVP